eukprot:gb/GFBE01071270.1/.p1 GENE.gb/GFBE01071270.1/~~gb/GFBE01071270.1/.p1  ORF type:complete len:514 (+),score=45.84 gb/GFBE01071270.1/:1-1542(+)
MRATPRASGTAARWVRCVLPVLLTLTGRARTVAVDPSSRQLSPCRAEYNAQFDVFISETGAHTRSDMADALHLLGGVMDFAEAQLTRCRSVGGRYWDVKLKMHDYMTSTGWGLGTGEYRPFDRLLPFGLCAPAACSRQDLAADVVPRLIGHILGLDHTTLQAAEDGVFQAHELQLWQDYSLDFALLGINRCGTTSLHFNLGQHPDIGFHQPDGEDLFFWRHGSILPHREDIEAFNEQVIDAHGHRPRVLGFRHSALFESPRMVHGLSRIPGLRALLVVCEPMGRLEKFFVVDHFQRCFPEHKHADGSVCAAGDQCQSDEPLGDKPPRGDAHKHESPRGTDEHSNSHADTVDYSLPRCWRSVAEAFDDPDGGYQSELHSQLLLKNPKGARHPLLEAYRVAPLLPGIQRIFGERLLLFHRESLDTYERETYDRIAGFLGVPPFPPQIVFQRKNAMPGHRTDLCRNASLVRRFKLFLKPEYQAIEEAVSAFGTLPPGVLARRTRCDLLQGSEIHDR